MVHFKQYDHNMVFMDPSKTNSEVKYQIMVI